MIGITSQRRLLLLPIAALVLLAAGGWAATNSLSSTGSKPASLTVSPTLAGASGDTNTPDCGNGFSTCTVTLSEPANANSPVDWSVFGGSLDGNPTPESFSPSHGSLKPGQSVTVKVTNMDCDPWGAWVFYGTPTIGKYDHGTVGASATFTCG